MSETKQPTMKISNVEIGTDYKAGEIIIANIEVAGFETVPNPQLSASFTDPSLAEKYNTDLPITRANIRINYTLPASAQKGIWTFKAVAFSGEQRDVAIKKFSVDEKIAKYVLRFVQPERDKLIKGQPVTLKIASTDPLTDKPVELKALRCRQQINGPETELTKDAAGLYSGILTLPDGSEGEITIACRGTLNDGSEADLMKKLILIDQLKVTIISASPDETDKNQLRIIVRVSRGNQTPSSIEMKLFVNGNETEARFSHGNGLFSALYPKEGVGYIVVVATDEYGQTASSQKMALEQKPAGPPDTSATSSMVTAIAAIAVILIILAAAYFFISRKPAANVQTFVNPDASLESWVREQYRGGYSAEYLQKYLKQRGYDPSIVEKVVPKA